MFQPRRIVWLACAFVGFGMLHLVAGPTPAAASAEAAVAQASENAGSPLSGTVTAVTGEPMEGVAVSARAAGKTVTTSVFTDQQGQYLFPPLAPPFEAGTYQVWAQAVGYERALADVTLASTQPAAQDFTLTTIDDFTHQLSGVEW